jgi:hypothetical protein
VTCGVQCILDRVVSVEPDSEAYRLAYEEAKRGLDDQEQAVVELRSRAGTLIAAAAITTSFFGSQARRHHVHTMSWVAIGCFVALGATVLAILWPRRDWEFTLSPARFISTYLEPSEGDPLSLPLIHRDLALHMGRSVPEPQAAPLADACVPHWCPPARVRSGRVGHRPDQPVLECDHGHQGNIAPSTADTPADPA